MLHWFPSSGGGANAVASCIGAMAFCALLASSAWAQDAGPSTERYAIDPVLVEPDELRIEFAILPRGLDDIVAPPSINTVRAVVGNVALGDATPTAYPEEGQTTAVLFLLDISNPARQPVVDRNQEQIAAMARAGRSHHQFGLATFAETLELVVPMGADGEALAAATREIRAVGQRTELIRLGAEAVGYISALDADRKIIVMLSDGEAEDDTSVYPASHFSDAARRADVRVYALGFHPSREATFGKMRFIAEQTGGALIRADHRTFELPEAFLAEPFAWMDAGGVVAFDLGPVAEAGLADSRTLTLEFERADGAVDTTQIDVALPAAETALTPTSLGERLRDHWPLAVMGFVVIVAGLALLVWLVLGSRRRDADSKEPLAYLEFLDGNGTRWPMRTKSIKIGRNSDNDLQLKNDTVSAYHATIHLQRDGTFVVTDLNSLNGVVVDGGEVEMAALNDGAELELGEVRCRFTVTGASAEGLLTANVADRTLSEEGS